MTIAIRHKKSRPAWLALIAVVAAGVTIVATLATVVIDSVIQARRTSEQPAPLALVAAPENGKAVRVTVPSAARQSPDALAAQAEAGARAAARDTAARLAASGPSVAGNGADDAAGTKAGLHSPVQDRARMQKTTADGVGSPTTGTDMSGHAVAPKHRYLPSRVAARAGVRRPDGYAGAGAAPEGSTAGSTARGEGTLRDDITRYNAERGNGAERRRALKLRAASVPRVRSLWDEVPRPLSELYRN